MSQTPVHWHEGLFLQPQHLQRMARHMDVRLAGERAYASVYPYGVINLRLSSDALANSQVRFDKLHVVTKSGLEIRVPESADLPALDIKRALAASPKAFTVCLAVPTWQATRANTIDPSAQEDPRSKRLFKVGEETVPDENTGENPQPMLVRRINARLIVEGEDVSEMEVMPLVRLSRAAGDELGLPRVETRFIPPCLTLSGSAILRKLLRDLTDAVEAARQEQAIQLGKSGWAPDNLRGAQPIQLMRLMSMNRFASRMPALIASAERGFGPSPLDLYLEVRDLLGGLVAMHPDRDPFEAPPYDHDDPTSVFFELDQKLRGWLKFDGGGQVKKIPFKAEERDLVVDLEPEDLTKPVQYLLGIRSKMDPKALTQLIEDGERFKMMPFKQRRLKLYGVRLAEERYPPMSLPTPPGQHYFNLDRAASERMWENVKSERRIALTWSDLDRFEYEEVALYLVYG